MAAGLHRPSVRSFCWLRDPERRHDPEQISVAGRPAFLRTLPPTFLVELMVVWLDVAEAAAAEESCSSAPERLEEVQN